MVWWLLAAVALAAAELAVSGLVFGMISIGALAAAVTTALGFDPWVDIAVFAVVSLGLILFVRPVAQRHLSRGPLLRSGVAALVGRECTVVEEVTASDGRIRLDGEIWSARSYDDQVHLPGATVHVVRIDGATAVII